MKTLRAHWITALTVVAGGFLAIVGVAFLAGAGEGDRGEFVALGIVNLIGAAALATGVWGLRSGRIASRVSNVLVVVGLIGVGLYWWMFVPAAVALVLLYAGVVRGGLGRELTAAH
jgi:hypothetical protein